MGKLLYLRKYDILTNHGDNRDEKYSNRTGRVDFVVYDEGIAIQVSYSLQDSDTEKREVDALVKLNKTLPMQKMIIIIKDEEKEIVKSRITIQVIPVWKWLITE